MISKETWNEVVESTPRIKQALDFMRRAHEGQTRKDGLTAYAVHPIRVAMRAAEIHQGDDIVIASLLHDVLEDSDIRYEEIYRTFGARVAGLVDQLTKPEEKHFRHKRYIARLATASETVRTLKFWDVVDNLEDLGDVDEDFEEFFLKRAEDYAKTIFNGWQYDRIVELVAQTRGGS